MSLVGSVASESVGWGDVAWAVVVTTVACIPIGVSLWALLDAARRPRWVWALSGHSQTPWIAAIAAGVLLTCVGLAISAWYLVRVRPDLRRIEGGELGELGPTR